MALSLVRSRVLLSLPLLVAIASCADDGTSSRGPAGDDGTVGEIGQELFANDKTMYEFFVGKGLKSFQAAGIVGNLDQESGGDPTAKQAGGPGRGIAQWSVGGRWDTSSNDNAVWYAGKQGQSVWSLQLQLEFIWYELTTFPGYGLSQLKATTNVTDATIVFQDKFEVCGTCVSTQRISYAKAVLNAYGSTTAPDYAAKFVSQTYPYASQGAVMLKEGQTVTGHIVMQNVGSKTWKAGVTKFAPIPHDKASPFHSPSWLSTTRVSTVKADVPPGSDGTFEWDLTGNTPGDFSPFFGFVEEGVTWFAQSGGPPDDQIQVHIIVAPAPTGTGGSGGSGGTGSAGKGGSPSGGSGGSATAGAGGSSSAGASGKGGAPTAGAGGSGAGASGKGGATSAGSGGSSAGASGAPASGGAGGSEQGSAGKAGAPAGSTGGQGGKTGQGGQAGQGGDGGDGSALSVQSDDSESSGSCSVSSVSSGRGGGRWALLAFLAPLGLAARRRRRALAAIGEAAAARRVRARGGSPRSGRRAAGPRRRGAAGPGGSGEVELDPDGRVVREVAAPHRALE